MRGAGHFVSKGSWSWSRLHVNASALVFRRIDQLIFIPCSPAGVKVNWNAGGHRQQEVGSWDLEGRGGVGCRTMVMRRGCVILVAFVSRLLVSADSAYLTSTSAGTKTAKGQRSISRCHRPTSFIVSGGCISRNTGSCRAGLWETALWSKISLDVSEDVPQSSDIGNSSDDSDTNETNEDSECSDQRCLRFGGVARLYANRQGGDVTEEKVLDRLAASTVAVIGLGGVGSWAAEALCRSGVGNLILVDLDDVCISNTNRQLHATSSSVGKMKIDVMEERLLDINPECNVTLLYDFVTSDSARSLVQSFQPELTACVDAIDGAHEKTSLILACVELGVPIVTCGGAAGRLDPTQIVLDDLTKVSDDRLLFSCRKVLRQKHGFPKLPVPKRGQKNRVRKWRIPAVYSNEVQAKPKEGGDTASSFRMCDGALGTGCFVTATYGFVAASAVIEMIAKDELIVPKRLGRQPERNI